MAQISMAIESSCVDERKKNASNYPLGWKRIFGWSPGGSSVLQNTVELCGLVGSGKARILFLRLKPLITIKEGFAPRNAITMPFYSAAMMMIGLVA